MKFAFISNSSNRALALGLLFASVLFSGPSSSSAQESADAPAIPITQAKYIPQRADDIAWENDRIAYRIYGPALEKKEPTGSGIDVWVKSVRYPIIDKWYKKGRYHDDSGEGLDFYGVGHSRGCGGLGIWDGQTLSVSGHWQSHEIKETGGRRAEFIVRYAPWKMANGQEVSEERTFVLEQGANLNRLTSVFTSNAPELIVGIGIAKIANGELYQNKEKGIMAFWPPENAAHGTIGQAVIIPPQDLIGFAEDKLNYLALVKVKPGKPFTYRAGACWNRGLDFTDFGSWKTFLEKEAAQ